MDISSALEAYLQTEAAAADRDPHGLAAFLRGAADVERRAAIELVVAAVLDDGKLSDGERSMLDRHATHAGDEVRTALSTVQAVMPFPSDAERRRFLAERADAIRAATDRERVLAVCVAILENANASNLEARCQIFASALGLSDAALARVRAK
jgi:hypothetical protein